MHGDVVKDGKVAGSPLIDVIRLLTIKGPDKIVSRCVTVDNKLEFLFVFGHELVKSLIFWF